MKSLKIVTTLLLDSALSFCGFILGQALVLDKKGCQ